MIGIAANRRALTVDASAAPRAAATTEGLMGAGFAGSRASPSAAQASISRHVCRQVGRCGDIPPSAERPDTCLMGPPEQHPARAAVKWRSRPQAHEPPVKGSWVRSEYHAPRCVKASPHYGGAAFGWHSLRSVILCGSHHGDISRSIMTWWPLLRAMIRRLCGESALRCSCNEFQVDWAAMA